MLLARTVACLATDINFGPCRFVSLRLWVVTFLEISCMALRTHGIHVLVKPCPVQRIAMGNFLIGIEVKPALPFRVPSNGEALKSAAWKFDQILLQRLDTEGVLDLEVG